MSNNFGLYIVDATKHLAEEGYPEPTPSPVNNEWVRTALKYNGSHINTTGVEYNRFGLYQKDGSLYLNGSVVCESNNSKDANVSAHQSSVLFGNVVLSKPNGVINITLKDYNTLRSGSQVKGYARYNDKAVYNIVNDVSNAPDNIEFTPPEGIYDVIYNSYTDELQETPLSVNTILDVNTPALDIRYVDQYINEGDGIVIEYFVDTKCYDSVNKGIIGDTFSIIVTDSYGNDIYHYTGDNGQIKHHTTYAGHYRITTDSFKDNNGNLITGKTWFSIRCVDNSGRGSCEYFFSVYIRASEYEEHFYDVTDGDLDDYGITYDQDSNNALAAYKNRCGFARLINDIKNNPNYNGIRFPNNNTINTDDIRSSGNRSYYINIYPDITYESVDKNLDNMDYVDRTENQANITYQKYYILRYNNGSSTQSAKLDSIDIKDVDDNDFETKGFSEVNGVNPAIQWDKLRPEHIEAFEIVPGKTFRIVDGTNTRDVTVSLEDGEDIVDWIWRDGAGICRDPNDKNRIIRHKDGVSDYDPDHETYVSNWRNTHCLRVIPINSNGEDFMTSLFNHSASYATQQAPGDSSSHNPSDPYYYPFKPGSGYYYVSFYFGPGGTSTKLTRYGISNLPVIDNFIIDFNYTSWKLYDALLISSRFNLLELGLCENVEVRNGWIKGLYDGSESGVSEEKYIHRLLKRGHVTQNRVGYIPFEGGGIANVVAGRFIKFNNMCITGSLGYDIMAHGPSSHAYTNFRGSAVTYDNYDSGYINLSGSTVRDGTCLVKEKGDSLIGPTSFDYDETLSTDICLATTVGYIELKDYTGYKYYTTNVAVDNPFNSANSRSFSDEFVVGHGSNRRSLKYPELFVHFFDSSNNYLKTVKTQINHRIKKPTGAAKIKITVYLTGAMVGGVPTLYYPSRVKKRLNRFKMSICGLSENIIYDSCYFGISKSSMIEPTAINMMLIGCTFDNVNFVPKNIKREHPYPISSEEHGAEQMLFSIIDSKIGFSRFAATVSGEESIMRETEGYSVRFAGGSKFLIMKNSIGFRPYGFMTGSYIENCRLTGFSPSMGPSPIPNAQNIIRNTVVMSKGAWTISTGYSTEQLTWLNHNIVPVAEGGDGKDKGDNCGSCEDPVNRCINFEDSFFNHPDHAADKAIITGRCYNDGTYPYDSYYSDDVYIDELWEGWKTWPNDGQNMPANWNYLVHFFVINKGETTVDMDLGVRGHAYIQGAKAAGNGNSVASAHIYLDGAYRPDICTLGGAQNLHPIVHVPNGYHIVSVELNTKVVARTNAYSFVIPKQAAITRLPSTVNGTLSLKSKFANGLDIANYGVMECNSSDAIMFFGAGTSTDSHTWFSKVYVPKGSIANYNALWGDISNVEERKF